MNPTIRIEGEHFVLSFPASHTIRIPLDRTDQLIAMLQARRAADLRIGERGSPTQWNIDRAAEVASIDTFCADKRANLLAELGL